MNKDQRVWRTRRPSGAVWEAFFVSINSPYTQRGSSTINNRRARSNTHRGHSTNRRARSTNHRARSNHHHGHSTNHRARSNTHRARSTIHRGHSINHRASSNTHRGHSINRRARSNTHRGHSTDHRARSITHSPCSWLPSSRSSTGDWACGGYFAQTVTPTYRRSVDIEEAGGGEGGDTTT